MKRFLVTIPLTLAVVLVVQAGCSKKEREPSQARDDHVATEVGTPVEVNVLANDGEPNNQFILVATDEPAHGTRETTREGDVIYTPEESFTGTDIFTYWAVDQNGNTHWADVVVTVSVPGSWSLERIGASQWVGEFRSVASAPALSRDGRYVTFGASDDTAQRGSRIFVYDRLTDQIRALPDALESGYVCGLSPNRPDITHDGHTVVFGTWYGGTGAADRCPALNLYVHEREWDQVEAPLRSSAVSEMDIDNLAPGISADGRFVAFDANATPFQLDSAGYGTHTFVYDRTLNRLEVVSLRSDGQVSDSWLHLFGGVSADGRCVVFSSPATDLIPEGTWPVYHVYVHDRQTRRTELVSQRPEGVEASSYVDDGSTGTSISGNGRYVAFTSPSLTLVPESPDREYDVFVRDRQAETTERISVAYNGTEPNGDSGDGKLSDDGRYVAFTSTASNLVVGDMNNLRDVFVFDRQTGQTARVSIAPDGREAADVCRDPDISPDGRYIAFWSYDAQLVPGDPSDTVYVAPNPLFR